MSFYKITDPKERRRMFEKLTQTRKNVQEQFLEDKIGKIESSQSLKKFFKPITESQRELTKEIKEQLTPIRDKVLTLPSQTLAIQPTAPPLETHEELMNVGPITAEYLEKFIDPEEVDKTFGIYLDKDQNWKIGNEKVELDGNDLTIVIPSDPNALLERLDLLMASKEASNTGACPWCFSTFYRQYSH